MSTSNWYQEQTKLSALLPKETRTNSFSIDIAILAPKTILSTNSSVNSVHFLAATIVHGLLLLLQLSDTFSNGHAVWNGARGGLALTSVDLKQGPNALANVAASRGLLLALRSVLQETLHFRTIGRRALGRGARRGVQK